jgi:hypothetical protein
MTTATENGSEKTERKDLFSRFRKLIEIWLDDLDLNVQLFLEFVNDEELPPHARYLAVGVVLYLLLSQKLIPKGTRWGVILALVGDVLVMIAGLSIIMQSMPKSRLAHYRQKYNAVAKIDEYEEILRAALGLLWDRLVQFVESLRQRHYKKATAEEVVQSPELREQLFDDAMEWVADQDLDPATLNKQLKQLPPPENVIGLLASGLEEEQEREDKDAEESHSWPTWRQLLPGGGENQEEQHH